jgi:precorrin-6Y C5,15-methyltransferase (decarboxylating)
LVLAEDGRTPAIVARHLCERGFGRSPMTVLEHMGGPRERRVDGTATDWPGVPVADLNTIAVECHAGPDARLVPRVPGLADSLYEHDGQLTKREVRAATIAALMPLPGQRLWDVGAGCGSVAVEWLRAEPTTEALAVERHAGRRAMMARNALAFGVPRLAIVAGEAPAALADLPSPDAVFVGGAVAVPGVLGACWSALRPGGRLVANSVSLQAETRLLAFRDEHGGELVRIAISHADAIGRMTVMRPAMPVLQYAGTKP